MKRLLTAFSAVAMLSVSSFGFAGALPPSGTGNSAPDASQGMTPPPGSDPRVQGSDMGRQGVQPGQPIQLPRDQKSDAENKDRLPSPPKLPE